ncbi:MAG: division/cell wall cluster transcriptional repressor MraZ [Rhodocyclaceae bacterium]|nr:division/cell wall cluster transcriptional repressor MraZ [Rhodocyclaceae bacterium]
MFQGAASLSLDAKGRLAVPARHREALQKICEGRLVITAHPHGCLLVYPEPAWAPIRDKVLAGSSLEQQSARLKRLFVGFARDEEVDGAGRLLISPELREYAQLDKQVWLVGQGKHFELWSDARWRTEQDEIHAMGDKLIPPGMEDLSL